MNKFLTLTAEQRRAVFERVGVNVGLPMQAVEKDFWVTVVLQTIFSLPVAQHLIFKGGTSLSKAWGLINRFSEDIDLTFIEDVKKNKDTYKLTDTEIIFEDGTIYTYKLEPDCSIYRNKVKICSNISFCDFSKQQQEDNGTIKNIINVHMAIKGSILFGII